MRVSFASALFLAAAASPLCAATITAGPSYDPAAASLIAAFSDPAFMQVFAASLSDPAVIAAARAAAERAVAESARSRETVFRKALNKAGLVAGYPFRRGAAVARDSWAAASGAAKAGALKAKDYAVSASGAAKAGALKAKDYAVVAAGAAKAGAHRAKDYVVANPRLVAAVGGSVAGGVATHYYARKYLAPYLFGRPAAPAGAEPAADGAPLDPVPASFAFETFDDEEKSDDSSSSSSPSPSPSGDDDELARAEAAALGPAPVSFSFETFEEEGGVPSSSSSAEEEVAAHA